MTLSEKMKKIVKELNMTQDTFIKNIQEQNREQGTKMSESSLKKIFSGTYNKDNRPTILTIDKIITYLKSLNNTKFKNISYDYLLNDDNININNQNIKINELTGLTDETIENIKKINLINKKILNHFINNIDINFWENIKTLKYIKEYEDTKNKLSVVLKGLDIKKENLLSVVDIFYKYSKDEKLISSIKKYRTLVYKTSKKINQKFPELSINNDDKLLVIHNYDKTGKLSDLHKEIFSCIYQHGELTFIDDPYILNQLKKYYKMPNISKFKELSFLMHKLSYLEHKIFNLDSFEYEEFDGELAMTLDAEAQTLNHIDIFIKNEILFPKETWTLIKSQLNVQDLSGLKSQLKYNASEYLTLYMNK